MDLESFQGTVNHHVFQDVNVRKPIRVVDRTEEFDVIDVQWDEGSDQWVIITELYERPIEIPTVEVLVDEEKPA